VLRDKLRTERTFKRKQRDTAEGGHREPTFLLEEEVTTKKKNFCLEEVNTIERFHYTKLVESGATQQKKWEGTNSYNLS